MLGRRRTVCICFLILHSCRGAYTLRRGWLTKVRCILRWLHIAKGPPITLSRSFVSSFQGKPACLYPGACDENVGIGQVPVMVHFWAPLAGWYY